MNLTVSQALEAILSNLQTSAVERVPLDFALGRRLAEEVTSPEDWPAFDQSAMDGYAVCWSDGAPLVFELVGESAAGHAFSGLLEPGQCVRIFTGAAVPNGTTAVVIQEHVQVEEGRVRVPGVVSGSNIRFRGENLKKDAVVFGVGHLVGASEVGLLASLRRASVNVFAAPRVHILSTGDELQPIEAPPSPHHIANSNAHLLAACCRAAGAVATLGPIIPDDPIKIRRAFEEASKHADLVISSGGVSVGAHDHVKAAMEAVGRMDFWRILMKPGKPLAFGHAQNGTPIFGLPGNPVSAFVCFQLFVYPALCKMQGAKDERIRVRATNLTEFKSPSDREEYVPGILVESANGLTFTRTGSSSSADITSFRGANGLACVPIGEALVPELASLSVLLI
jgi:molybdopterin molybdotransferase